MRESEHHCVKSRRIWLAQTVAQDEEQLGWQTRRRWPYHAVTVGLLIFLGIDATHEALKVTRELCGAFQALAWSRLASFPPYYCWTRSHGGR